MKPLEVVIESLMREWIETADADLEVAIQMRPYAANGIRMREIVGSHCQQAAEKYLKALLTHYQVEFPKTHKIGVLLDFVSRVRPDIAAALRQSEWLTPFGVDIRYPTDFPEMLPGDEVKAIQLAEEVKRTVAAVLAV